MRNVSDYLDYRAFLRDRVALLKAKGPAFSIRNLNRRAGLKSSGHLNLILSGRRNLGRNALYKVCRGFGLTERESQFFVNLVNFNQAGTLEEKNHFYQRLLKSYPPKRASLLDPRHYKMFSHWYYVGILELTRLEGFKVDPSWISKKLRLKVPREKIKDAFEELVHLGLVQKNQGRWEPTNTMVTTPDAVRSLLVTNFQEQMSRLSMESLKKDDANDKEFSTLTIAVSPKDFAEVKRRLQELRRELHTLVESSGGRKTMVAHLNLQLFKLTAGGGGRNGKG